MVIRGYFWAQSLTNFVEETVTQKLIKYKCVLSEKTAVCAKILEASLLRSRLRRKIRQSW